MKGGLTVLASQWRTDADTLRRTDVGPVTAMSFDVLIARFVSGAKDHLCRHSAQ